ncbi:hypothetical protein TNCV_2674801 [Trichonephila clavipes]|nr:hypothetical protein TNCV_2674801 [Trichonephila clavipes]
MCRSGSPVFEKAGKVFLTTPIAEDRYDLETKRQIKERRSPASPRWEKARAEKSHIKTILITIFDSQGIIHKKFLPEETTMNTAKYIEILIPFLKRLCRLRLQYAHHD